MDEENIYELHEKLSEIGFEIILDGDKADWGNELDVVFGAQFDYTCPSCGEIHLLKRIISSFSCSHCHYKVKWKKTKKWKKYRKNLGLKNGE
ncbi:MAG: hypothetical protein ACTSUR_08430 [Candidatus Heimdallarchaeaceae archaeon]